MVYELENIAIMDVKGVNCICVTWNVSRSNAIE